MSQKSPPLRWGVERKLQFIEFRLFWEGHVNRADLTGQFGVSVNQASNDLRRYLKLAPGNMVYDTHGRTYRRGEKFKARYLVPEAEGYLSQLRSIEAGLLPAEEAWISELPVFDATPTPVRGVAAETLRAVTQAIHQGEALEVQYQSLSRPAPAWRWIAPHALAFDGFRWHARAYCLRDCCFKDFLLSRILKVRGAKPSEVRAEADADWAEQVTLVIGPHPGLSPSQQKIIARDYGMRRGRARLRVRRALLYYALKRLGLDTDPDARRPQDQQIVLLNREEVMGSESRQVTGGPSDVQMERGH